MTLSHVLFGSDVGLRALNKIFLYRFQYFLYFDACSYEKNIFYWVLWEKVDHFWCQNGIQLLFDSSRGWKKFLLF